MKIKLLFDMEQLVSSKGKGLGIERVAYEFLKGLSNESGIDVYPLITTKKGDIVKYLESVHLEKLQNKIIYMPNLRRTLKCGKWYKSILAQLLIYIFSKSYKRILSRFDAYFSPFSPISPIVYKSNITTYIFIHDLIPIYHPEYCSKKFAIKYKNWMQNLAADNIICNSKYTQQDLLKFRPDLSNKNIQVTYLASDNKFIQMSDKNALKTVKDKYQINTKKYFLALSALTPRKNFVHLLKAFVLFLSKNKDEDVSLVLVGPKHRGYNDILKTISTFDDYKNNIIQTGYADEQDLAALYSGATAFVYPSLYEGFGLPVLEAMQCGTPVICTDNSSLPEVGGDAVLYITGKDEKETADTLTRLYQNSSLSAELSQKGLQRAQLFSWEKSVKEILSCIQTGVKK